MRSAESEDKKAVAAQKKIGEIRSKLATLANRKRSKERALSGAEKSAASASDRADQQRLRKEKADQADRDREAVRRRQTEKDHAREVARLSRPMVHHVFFRDPEPERLRVLYLTSSPGNEAPLRVDAEVNNVLKALRSAKHRDLVDLQHRPAAGPQDLIDAINDHRPHVIHFSGHGAATGLLFDTNDLEPTDGQFLDFEPLATLLKATSFPPTLIVLNACHSEGGAEILLEAAPVVIAMSDTVGDMSAGLFATHFYAAIGGAQSIASAVDQAKAMIAIALPDTPDLIVVSVREGYDAHDIQLVKPT